MASSAYGTAINYDIDNYDREDAEKWDIGADQFVASATTNASLDPLINLLNLQLNGQGSMAWILPR